MERSEWLEQAVYFDGKAQEAYEKGEVALGDYYSHTAQACRTCAAYAPETEDASDKK